MKRVSRRVTYRGMTRRPPWTWRETWKTVAPRTCLTHQVDPVYYDPEAEEPLEIGKFDHLLRLYQHYGASPASVKHPSMGIAYFEHEWQAVLDKRVEWFEFVDPAYRTVYRVDFGTALRYGSWESTPRGWMWVVPVEQYTTVTL